MRENVYCDDQYAYIEIRVGDLNEEKINAIIKEKQDNGYKIINDNSFLEEFPPLIDDTAVKFFPERIITFQKFI